MKVSRIYTLDLLRFLASVLVVFFHYFFVGQKVGLLDKNWYFGIVSEVSKYGHLGVRLFFIISGFVIIMSAENAGLLKFVRSRFLRLYPAYWICLTFSFFFILLWGDPHFKTSFVQYLANLTMLNDLIGINGMDGAYWSLLVEIRFYFLVGMLLYIGWMKRLELILWVWISITFFCKIILEESFLRKALNFVFINGFSPLFIAGITFFQIYKTKLNPSYLSLIIICYFLAINQLKGDNERISQHYSSNYSFEVTSFIVLVFFIAFLLISTKYLEIKHNKFIEDLGSTTYPLYLVHQVVGYIIFIKIYSIWPYKELAYIVLIGMIIFSMLIYRKLEVPFVKFLSSKWRYIEQV